MNIKLDIKKLNQLMPLLGTQADTRLAQQFGCLSWEIAKLRKDLCIPAFRRVRESPPYTPPDNIQQLLKTYRNSDLVAQCEIPKEAIAYLRQLYKIPQPASSSELQRKRRRNEIERLLQHGLSPREIRKKTGVTFNGMKHILEQKSGSIDGSRIWPLKCTAALQAHGFRTKKEIRTVFDCDPSYFLCITGVGKMAVAEIAAWLGKPAPAHVSLKALQWWPVRRINGEYRHIAAPDEKLRQANPLNWHVLNVETGTFQAVLITASGCRRHI